MLFVLVLQLAINTLKRITKQLATLVCLVLILVNFVMSDFRLIRDIIMVIGCTYIMKSGVKLMLDNHFSTGMLRIYELNKYHAAHLLLIIYVI